MTKRATLLREGELGILRIDHPPVNALSVETIAHMIDAFGEFEADGDLVALVVECAGRTFIAGGDIADFENAEFSTRPINTLLERMEASRRPIVASLFGTVLGGGLEVAMACHARVARPDTRLGMPEITLGLIPGSLGTQRLPRLVGLRASFEMMSTGKPISAARARELGLVDDLAPQEAAGARQMAKDLAAAGGKLRRASELMPAGLDEAEAVLADAKARGEDRAPIPAYAALARCLEAAAHQPYKAGEAVEAREFAELRISASSRALRHVFFAERAVSRIPGIGKDVEPMPVASIGIVGAGTMGGGIATSFANAGFPVILVETNDEALSRGLAAIARNYEASVTRGRMSEANASACQARMTGSTDIAALAEVDLVIEAVFEDMALKLDVARQLGRICKPGAILATNTSTLDVDRIAQASGRPGDVLGTHFFSPAHIMRLLEVVRGDAAEPRVLKTVMDVARRIGKTAVVSGVCYGFIGNRMAEVYARENEAMQLEGATPAQIDGVAENPDWIGMAMGPSRMLDMAGVDVGARTVIEWRNSGEGPQAPGYRAMCRALFERGKFGQKTGEGFYRYEGRKALPSRETEALAVELAKRHGIQRRETIPDQEIFERLLFPMINEAVKILEEGIALRPGDIDVVWTSGYGFPRWRGGPVFMADEIGLGHVVDRLDHYAQTLGNDEGYWAVSGLLRETARSGGRLSDIHK